MALLSCRGETATPEDRGPTKVAADIPQPVAEELLTNMDRNTDPCADFYRYACGGWLDATELPGDESRWARSFSEIAKRNREVLREILEDDATAADPDIPGNTVTFGLDAGAHRPVEDEDPFTQRLAKRVKAIFSGIHEATSAISEGTSPSM